MKQRDVETKLKRAGCTRSETKKKGPHDSWDCPCGKHTTAVPRHKQVLPGTINNIIKQLPCLEKGWLQ